MQAIRHLYITNQSTKNTAQSSKRNASKRQQSASGTCTGRTHKEEGTGSRAEQGVTETRARKVSEDASKEEAQQTAPQGANQQQKTQRWTAVCRISASYKG
jgi:hypothetical protein